MTRARVKMKQKNGTFHVYFLRATVCCSHLFVCHQCIRPDNPYITVCVCKQSYVTRMHSCVLVWTRMLLAYTPMYSYVTPMYSYVTRMSYVLICHSYVTRMYLYVTGMYSIVCYSNSLVCTRMYSYVLLWCFSRDHLFENVILDNFSIQLCFCLEVLYAQCWKFGNKYSFKFKFKSPCIVIEFKFFDQFPFPFHSSQIRIKFHWEELILLTLISCAVEKNQNLFANSLPRSHLFELNVNCKLLQIIGKNWHNMICKMES